MGIPAHAPPARRIVGNVVAFLYVATYGTLIFLGIQLWRTYCEGFGCTGIGIAWFAWSVAYVVVLIVGLVAHGMHRGVGRRVFRYGLASQLVAGAVLLAYWAAKAGK